MKMAKCLWNAVQMVLFLWASEHGSTLAGIQRNNFLSLAALAQKWLCISVINVVFLNCHHIVHLHVP